MKIAIGSDHAGFDAKEEVKAQLGGLGHEVVDAGAYDRERTDYPDYAHKVANLVRKGEAERGVLVCGTGIGVCIAANKVPGIRAALPYSVETARLAREHNDTNVLCLGGRTMTRQEREEMVKVWLETPFEGGRHAGRVDKLEDIE
jgi:ribose 5-phosphate isomerase B